MSDVRAQLAAEFTNGEVRQFTGRGGKTFDYIEDETVMDRLDEVFGVGMWSVFVEPISVADGIVKVTLKVSDATYEDFGYANRTDGEALKEAVSDGIRRCGRFLGIARYLYKKHETRQNGSGRPQPARAPVHASAPADPFPDDLMADIDPESMTDVCAEHGVPWIGSVGDRYHKKPEGGYCRTAPNNVAKPVRSR
jgi:hypothetical protein